MRYTVGIRMHRNEKGGLPRLLSMEGVNARYQVYSASRSLAWAAASRATGTRGAEQET